MTDVREFYDNLLHRIRVKFAPKHDDGNMREFELDLSKRMTYAVLAQRVAEALGSDVDPTHLRFSPVNASNGRAKVPVRHTTTHNLGAILTPGYNNYGATINQRADALYYEVLEVSMSELETRKNVKVIWLTEGVAKEDSFEILVPKNGTIVDIIKGLQRKVGTGPDGIPDDHIDRIRVYETHANKIFRDCPATWPVANLNEFVQLYAELTPEGESLSEIDEETECLIPVYHFDKEHTKPHGTPFIFKMIKDEMFKDTKERISKRTGIKGKALERIKFAAVPRHAYGTPEAITDGKSL
jgi:ubiquitin carboxyl-terminal hydrolase 7